MPLSTSNSDPASRRSWGRAWAIALALAVLCLGAVEGAYRVAGYRPSLSDDKLLWALFRDEVYAPKTVVLSGASRIHVGFDTGRFRQRYPDHVLKQLAIPGRWPVAVLRDLSEDEAFSGLVIISLDAPSMMEEEFESQQPWVDRHRRTPNHNLRINRRFKYVVDAHVVLREKRVSLRQHLLWLLDQGRIAPPQWIVMNPDRSLTANYRWNMRQPESGSRADPAEALNEAYRGRYFWVERLSPEAWLQQALQLDAMADRIAGRGGAVVFLRYPTTGDYWRHSEEVFPKARYWDLFAAQTDHTTVHFIDHPSLQRPTADGSHLFHADVGPFTDALLDILEDTGDLPRPDPAGKEGGP